MDRCAVVVVITLNLEIPKNVMEQKLWIKRHEMGQITI
jgi:hypothetical protein